MERMLTDNIVIDDETGNLYLILDEDEVVPANLSFEFDIKTGNCYIDESTVFWKQDYYKVNNNGEIVFVKGGI